MENSKMDELTKHDVIDLTQDDGVHHHYVNKGEESDTEVHLRIEQRRRVRYRSSPSHRA